MSTSQMRIGVVGAGATGGYLSAALTVAGHNVTVLARGSSAEIIRENGIEVRGPDGYTISARPARVVTATDELDPVDVTLVCVKSYDTEAVVRDISNLVGDKGLILCLQNGVANEDMLARAYGASRILSGVLYIGSERVKPGVIERSTEAKIILGPYQGFESRDACDWIQAAFQTAGIECTIDDSIRAAKWQKYLFNCGLNPLTALTGMRLASIRSGPWGQRLFGALVDEAIAAAFATGAPLDEDFREQVNRVADRMNISSSMAEDLAAGRAMELDAFSGHVLHLSEQCGIDAPVTGVIHDLLTVLDRRGS